MSITTTILRQSVHGDDRVVYGKSVLAGSSSSEDVVTGLAQVEFFEVAVNSSSPAYATSVEDFPLASGSVTVKVSANDQTLYWKAEGK
jgi:streptogramin lyase